MRQIAAFILFLCLNSAHAADTEKLMPTTGPDDVLRAVTILVGAVQIDPKAKLFADGMGVDGISRVTDIKRIQTSDGHLAYVYSGQKSAGMSAPFTLQLRVDSAHVCSQGSPDTADSSGCSDTFSGSFIH